MEFDFFLKDRLTHNINLIFQDYIYHNLDVSKKLVENYEIVENYEEAPFDEDINEKIVKQECNIAINNALETLKPRDIKIIKLYYGFEDGKPMTESQIAKEFNLSKSAVSLYLNKALKKMRHPSRSKIIYKSLSI